MAYTFDPSLGDVRSQLRLVLGDTGRPWIFPDETLDAILATADIDYSEKAARAAEAAAAFYLKKAQRTKQGAVERQYADRVKYYQDLAARFRAVGTPTGTLLNDLPQVGELKAPDLTNWNDIATGGMNIW